MWVPGRSGWSPSETPGETGDEGPVVGSDFIKTNRRVEWGGAGTSYGSIKGFQQDGSCGRVLDEGPRRHTGSGSSGSLRRPDDGSEGRGEDWSRREKEVVLKASRGS